MDSLSETLNPLIRLDIKKGKSELARIYGKQCMFEQAHIAERIEAMGGIRTYKKFLTQMKFKGKKISKRLTYHHLRHRSEGGDVSVENGALIEETPHQYLHSLSRDEEEIINNMLREYKINFAIMQGNGEILDSGSLVPDFSDCITIPVYDNIPNQVQKRRRLKNPTRAMKKKELNDLIREYEEDEDEFER